MIRVRPADEPDTFDAQVRQPGLRALQRRIGIDVPGAGRPPRNTYSRPEEVPPAEFPPEWRKAIPDLLERYAHLCAYTALYIEPGTGDATVDHFIPISVDWRMAYEWKNYRLACRQVNTDKGRGRPLDPFEIEDGWFELELVGYQVVPGAATAEPLRAAIRATIEDVLRLNSARLRRQRSEYAESYLADDISLAYLERRAPFVARELRRQGKLRPADLAPV